MAWYRCGMNGTYNATTVSRSGTICNYIANVGGVPLSRFIANITPIQEGSGDPSPSNPRPITGRSAVNVNRTDKNLEGGATLANDIQAYIPSANNDTGNRVISYVASADTTSGLSMFNQMKNRFKENTAYTLVLAIAKSNSNIRANMRVYYTDGTSDIINIPEESITANTKYTFALTFGGAKTISRIAKQAGSGTSYIYYDECGLFEGTLTVDQFTPYTGQTATINLGGTYYGGTLNVGTGVLTVDRGGVILDGSNDENWFFRESGNTTNVFSLAGAVDSIADQNDQICSLATYNSQAYTANDNRLNTFVLGTSKNLFVQVSKTTYPDVSSFKTMLSNNPCVVLYSITPQTYQLTPAQITQLLGENNVWADSGDSEVDFFKIIRT